MGAALEMHHIVYRLQLLVQKNKNSPLLVEVFPSIPGAGAASSVWHRSPSPVQCQAWQDLGAVAVALMLNNH